MNTLFRYITKEDFLEAKAIYLPEAARWDYRFIPAGIYTLKLSTGTNVLTQPMKVEEFNLRLEKEKQE